MLRRLVIASGIISLTVLSSLALAQTVSSTSEEKAKPYSQRADVQTFIKDVARRRKLDEAWIASVLDRATYQPRIERLMTPKKSPPGVRDSRKDWEKYRAIFIENYRINLGSRFWQKNKTWLDKAQEVYKVDPAVIVGIIGVETRYGENTGSWKVLDSLVTLSFDYKRRADYFKKELEDFLVMVNKNNLKPLEVLGSYAGAVGLPQFMPSSISRFGVDFDGDGKVNLNSSVPDTIGSVANYLAKNGWRQGLPMAIEADITAEQAKKFGGGTNAKFTWRQLLNGGVKPLANAPTHSDAMAAWIVDFPYYKSDDLDVGVLYRVGTKNFTAVLRYNSSYFYAGAVAELGTAIAKKVNEPGLIEGSAILPKKPTTVSKPVEEPQPETSEVTPAPEQPSSEPSEAVTVTVQTTEETVQTTEGTVQINEETIQITPLPEYPNNVTPTEQSSEILQPDVIIEKVTPLP